VIGGSSYRNVGKERASGGDFSSFSLLLEMSGKLAIKGQNGASRSVMA
jgi:hypothetical protein